jgi:xanthine dehydrogenase YagS FAD-binding subunit
MRPFSYVRPTTREEAQALLSATARPKGGGMDLLDLAKRGVSTPATMVDVARLPEVGKTWRGDHGETYLGAGMTLAAIAASAEIAKHCPAASDAAAEAATPQVRARATVVGSLLQRPRCAYFRDPFFDCLKRGGTTCPARDGHHDDGAIFGNGRCCAVHPSNLATALAALGAEARILAGKDDEGQPRWRTARLDESFWIAPEEDSLREARVEPGELVFDLIVPAAPASAYAEVDWKQSFDWASASAAVALAMEGGKVADARVYLGFVAPVPLRSKAAEEAIKGKEPAAAAEAAGRAAAKGATPLPGNAYKVRHVEVAVKRAVLRAASRAG